MKKKRQYKFKYFDEVVLISKPYINFKLLLAIVTGKVNIKITWSRNWKIPRATMLISYIEKGGE